VVVEVAGLLVLTVAAGFVVVAGLLVEEEAPDPDTVLELAATVELVCALQMKFGSL
jgi:hypothetical protein